MVQYGKPCTVDAMSGICKMMEVETTKEICIDVQISENSKTCGGKIDVSYDNTLLKPEKYEIEEPFSGGMFLVNLNYAEKISETDFADNRDISVWAKNGIAFASSRGYVKGKGNNIFDPKGYATRAELAAILKRFYTSSK